MCALMRLTHTYRVFLLEWERSFSKRSYLVKQEVLSGETLFHWIGPRIFHRENMQKWTVLDHFNLMFGSFFIAIFLLTKNGPRGVIICTTNSPKVTTGSCSFKVCEQVQNNTFKSFDFSWETQIAFPPHGRKPRRFQKTHTTRSVNACALAQTTRKITVGCRCTYPSIHFFIALGRLTLRNACTVCGVVWWWWCALFAVLLLCVCVCSENKKTEQKGWTQ